jgi:hypothetical protein
MTIMKKIFNKIRLISILFIIFLSSCSKDFLDKNPTDQLSAGTFYTSKNSIDMALTACYATLQSDLFTSSMPFYDCLADNGYNFNNYYSTTTLSQGPITSTSGGYISTVYSSTYSWIARYNIFLKTLAAYNLSDVSTQVKTTYEAEVRLLRAMKYFDLYKFYGSVPLVTEPVTIENQYQPKVDASKVLAQINTDLDFAISNLPDLSYANNSGHLVKSSAQVLKARVLLFDAYNDDGTAKSDVMAQVKAITSDIIGKNYYSIAPSFRGLFCDELGKQEGNPEFIFSVKYLAPNDFTSTILGWGQAATYTGDAGSPGGALLPLANFANEFEFNDGSPFSVSNPLYDGTDIYKNRDPRMAKTIFSVTTTFENGFTLTILPSPTGYSYRKHIQGSDAKNIYANMDGSDWPAMRYAEVLLMYAEAANEVDGPSTAVYSAINQIRSRADILMPNLPLGLTKDQMRTAIRHERRIELAFEGFRYDDLKRWKIAEQVLTMSASASIISKSFLKINYHLPLPQSEIDINHGALVQNSDYK